MTHKSTPSFVRSARINTSFLLILAISITIGVGIIGAIYYVARSKDTQRFLVRGDEAMQKGDYALAYEWYGKAVAKKPSVIEYLEKAEGALRKVVPTTSITANEKYRMLLALLEHKSTAKATDPQSHIPYITELWDRARMIQTPQAWAELARAGAAMYDRVPAENPDRNLGLYYKALGALARNEASDAEQDQAETDMQTAIDALSPTDPRQDVGRGSLAIAQRIRAERLAIAGQPQKAEAKRAQAEETLKRGLEVAPEGITVAKAALLATVSRSQAAEPIAPDDPAFIASIDRASELAAKSADPIAMAEVATTLSNISRGYGTQKAQGLLEDYLHQHPDAIYHRSLLAQIQLENRDFEGARKSSAEVIAANPLPVSLLSIMQEDLRVQAAAMMVKIAFNQWDAAQLAEKPSRVAAVQEAYDSLLKTVTDPDNLAALEAAGKLEVAKGRFDAAAAKFERMISRSSRVDAEIYFLAATSAERLNELGHALDRLNQAIDLQPNNIALLAYKAEYLRRLGRFEEARNIADAILSVDPKNVLATRIKTILDSEATTQPQDPVASRIREAMELSAGGQPDDARQMLEIELEKKPDDVRLIRVLANLFVVLDRRDDAAKMIDRGLALVPADSVLNLMKASLQTDDPVQRLKQLLDATIADPNERIATLYSQLRVLTVRFREGAKDAEAKGESENAAKYNTIANNADAAAKETLATALVQAPTQPLLIEQLFTDAVVAKDWTEAERVAAIAQKENTDQTQGLIFKGRLEIARQNYVAAILALTEAKTVNTFSSVIYRLLGIAHQQAGNTDEAIAAFQESYERRPTDLMNVALYSELLAQSGDRLKALTILRQARNLAPNNAALIDRQLQLEAEVGDKRLAFNTRNDLFAQEPNNQGNTRRLATMLARQWPQREDILEASGREQYSVVEWTRLSAAKQEAVLTDTKLAWIKRSDDMLAALATEAPRDLELAALRAKLLSERGKADAGEKVLRDLIAATPEKDRTWEQHVTLGDHLLRADKPVEAAAAFQEGVKLQNPAQRDADAAIAALYFDRGQYKQALDHLNSAIEGEPNRRLFIQAAEANAMLQQFEQAQARLDDAAKLLPPGAPGDATSELLAARIAQGQADTLHAKGETEAAKGKYFAQIQAIERAKKLSPASALPWLADGARLLDDFRRNKNPASLDEATRAADQALQRRADLPQAIAIKVNVLRAKGELDAAVAQLEKFVKESTTFDGARRDLIGLLLQNRNDTRAVQVAREGITANPFKPDWHTTTGQLLARTGKIDEATIEFRRADELQPSAGSLASLVEVLFIANPPKLAEARALLEKRMDQVKGAAYLEGAYAAALAGSGSRDAAIAQLKKAYAGVRAPRENANRQILVSSWLRFATIVIGRDKPTELEALIMELSKNDPDSWELLGLAGIASASGPAGLDRSIDFLAKAIAKAPAEDTALRTQLYFEHGNAMIAKKNYAAAATSFEECIKLDSRHADSLNNLAYLCAKYLNDAARGLPAAQKAVELNPNSIELRDTLGLLYTMLGKYKEAEDEFRKGLKLGNSPELLYHFAELLVKTDRKDTARTYLNEALKLNPDPELRKLIEAPQVARLN